MKIEIECPSNFQGNMVGDLNSRQGLITYHVDCGRPPQPASRAKFPLATTFGYSTTLRSMTQGQGTFTMEFFRYRPVPAQHRAQR